jgi:hypothetical protein
MGQHHFFTQAGFDQLDDILNAGREAWRRLGLAMDGGHWQDQAGRQTDNCDVLLQFNQKQSRYRASRTHNEHSNRFHLNNMAHLQCSTRKECPRLPGM